MSTTQNDTMCEYPANNQRNFIIGWLYGEEPHLPSQVLFELS